jgi:spore coat polysaccharide biosynthesis predicted glycosyltransferase SpsG
MIPATRDASASGTERPGKGGAKYGSPAGAAPPAKEKPRVVFVVIGYPAVGLGHVYRTMMLAEAMPGCDISFLCTRESAAFALEPPAALYPARKQQSDELWRDVSALRPDLVINDMLNTDEDYMRPLKEQGLRLVNFEDEGPGAAFADLVINALYERVGNDDPRRLYGHRNFCLRDEFLNAARKPFSTGAEQVLITFGGTDASDFTRNSVDALYDICMRGADTLPGFTRSAPGNPAGSAASGSRPLRLRIVAGPGYAHHEALEEHLTRLDPGRRVLYYTHATNVMSAEMEKADFAVCSAGRTVYELAHMRIPAIVLSHHEREDMHGFARPENGFLYLGVMNPFRTEALRSAFLRMTDAQERRALRERMEQFDFTGNKARVVAGILALLRR